MTKYAVIRIKRSQFKVAEGDEILVNKLNSDKVDPEVLLVVDGEKADIGKPLTSAKVTLKVLKEVEKGEKVKVMKYKSKSRYRKTTGFRPKYTRLQVVKIS